MLSDSLVFIDTLSKSDPGSDALSRQMELAFAVTFWISKHPPLQLLELLDSNMHMPRSTSTNIGSRNAEDEGKVLGIVDPPTWQ